MNAMGRYKVVIRGSMRAALFCLPLIACLSGCNPEKEKEKEKPQELPELHAEPQKHHDEKVKTVDVKTAPFIAGKKATVFHKRDCPYATRLDSPVGFESAGDARSGGRIPCVFCNP